MASLEDVSELGRNYVTLSNVINDFKTGKVKVFGRITPTQIRESIMDKLDKIARERENAHLDLKGPQGDRSTLTLREALAKVTTQK